MRKRVFPITKRGWRAAQRRDRRFRRVRHGFNLWELRHSRAGFMAKLSQYLRGVSQRERACPRCGAPLIEDPHHGECPSEECPFYGHPRYSCVRALTSDECTFEGRCPQVLRDYERERTAFLRVLEARRRTLAREERRRRRETRRRRRRRSEQFKTVGMKLRNGLLELFLGVGNLYLLYRARRNLLWTLKVREYALRLEAQGRSLDEFR